MPPRQQKTPQIAFLSLAFFCCFSLIGSLMAVSPFAFDTSYNNDAVSFNQESSLYYPNILTFFHSGFLPLMCKEEMLFQLINSHHLPGRIIPFLFVKSSSLYLSISCFNMSEDSLVLTNHTMSPLLNTVDAEGLNINSFSL